MPDEQLIADLRATFPGIHARPALEYGVKDFQDGVWVAGEACMPDGLPIFCDLACADPDHYNGLVHHAFEAWLQARGYDLECWDAGVYFAVPLNRSL